MKTKLKNYFLMVLLSITLVACGQAWSTPSGTVNPISLTWESPTTNTDGSIITDGAGYRIYCGEITNGPYTLKQDILGWAITSYDLSTNWADGSYYCVLTSYDTSGNESDFSNEINFNIDHTRPGKGILKIKIK